MSDSDADSCDWEAVAGGVQVKLTEDDIPGASLSEPLETHTIPELKWWLLCRGVQPPTSWKKAQIISQLVCFLVTEYLYVHTWYSTVTLFRIREAKSKGLDNYSGGG